MIVVALFAASALWPGYANDAAVEGLRPASEIRAALEKVSPQLSACEAPGEIVVDVDLLAAGFVDRITPLSSSGTVDPACVAAALRAMTLTDRGQETATHVVVRVVFGDGNKPLTPSPRALSSALEPVRDDVARCIVKARAHGHDDGGTVLLRMKLDDRGDAVDVDARDGTLRNDDARACIAASLHKLHVDNAIASAPVYVLHIDKPKPVADARTSSFLDKPTLFDVLGCASAFR